MAVIALAPCTGLTRDGASGAGSIGGWRHLVGEDMRERADERAVSDGDGARPTDVADGSDA